MGLGRRVPPLLCALELAPVWTWGIISDTVPFTGARGVTDRRGKANSARTVTSKELSPGPSKCRGQQSWRERRKTFSFYSSQGPTSPRTALSFLALQQKFCRRSPSKHPYLFGGGARSSALCQPRQDLLMGKFFPAPRALTIPEPVVLLCLFSSVGIRTACAVLG